MYIDDTCKIEPNARVIYEVALDLFLMAVGQYPTGNFDINRKGVKIFRLIDEAGLKEGVYFPNGSSVQCTKTPEDTKVYINGKEISNNC